MADIQLEIRHLKTLLAIRETGSVSRAAERVFLTQSALSHQLKALEAAYAQPLLNRKGQRVILTAAGERLAQLADTVLAQIRAAERDLAQLASKSSGTLRIALECHTCFDWLMPVMNDFRQYWPDVELDLVSGFHSDPLALLSEDRADVVIGSDTVPQHANARLIAHPLFGFEIMAVLPTDHALSQQHHLTAADFAAETLITYPVPEERIDLIRKVLQPAGIAVTRRTAELTIAILQLVASRRGVAALPSWGLKNYLDYDHVCAKRIGSKGLWSELYAITTEATAARPYMQDFLKTAVASCFATLPGLVSIRKTGLA